MLAKSFLLVLISLAASTAQFSQVPRKHWRRAAVHGAFNVDAYAYNKPMVNLVGHLPPPGQALPMGQLLEQLAQSSRLRALPKGQYRNLDREPSRLNGEPRQSAADFGGSLEPSALAALNSQLAKLQMNLSLDQANIYSHEFHVENKGNRKIVLINTLDEAKTESEQPLKEEPEQEQLQLGPLNVKLALPVLGEGEGVTQKVDSSKIVMNTEAISSMKAMQSEMEESKKTKGANDSKERANDATTIEMESTATATTAVEPGQQQHSETVVNAKQEQVERQKQKLGELQQKVKQAKAKEEMKTHQAGEMQQQKEKQLQQAHQLQMKSKKGQSVDDVAISKKRDRHNDNDAQANGMNMPPKPKPEPEPEIKPTAVGAGAGAADKPLGLASKPKSKRRQTQTKTKIPNGIDTKPNASSAAQSNAPTSTIRPASTDEKLTTATADVKAPAMAINSYSQATRRPILKKGNKIPSKGKGKRRGAQRRPSAAAADEQDIETTTNWWQILPYAEIRKFLNTIYDSMTDEADDERAQQI
ncbi:differentially expressed in FDCP 6 [Drosophila virilis]|uniref:Uncharacterized protein n=1 Tax=Drosophila virilis TaxID=7244 RepID=A0A0Q9WCJ7_DROVI|nr:mediator of RNA polymerase II transcription subunit 15 [Drosophila virilis]KRF78555.1 uncharacterized protein Dvir_GJ26933 [Drosophila virilis]